MRRAAELGFVDRIIHVGSRGIGSARAQDVADTLARGNTIVTARAVRERGIAHVLQQLPAGGNYHVALDCDGLDPAVMPGTSAPAPGGLGYDDVAALFRALGSRGHIAGFNLAEHYPALDVNGITALTAVRLIVNLMAGTRIGNRTQAPPTNLPGDSLGVHPWQLSPQSDYGTVTQKLALSSGTAVDAGYCRPSTRRNVR